MPDNTINWGQGAINNDIGWGKGKANNDIGWGAIYDDSPSGDTNLTGASATPFTNTKSIAFDGVDDYADFGNPSSLDMTGALSISFWLKAPNQTQYRGIISKAPNTASIVSNAQYHIEVFGTSTKTIRFVVTGVDLKAGTETTGSVPRIDFDEWMHIVMTWNGSNELIVYKNGVQSATRTTTSRTITSNSNDVLFGRRLGYGYLEGNMDEVAFFNSALSASDVSSIYNNGAPASLSSYSSLVSWYRMGDGDTFPTISDNKGSNDGTMTNMTSGDIETDVPTAFTNTKSLIFDGVNDILKIKDSTTAPTEYQGLGNANSYSISFWLKSTDANASSIYWYSNSTMIEIRTQTSSGTHAPFSIGLKSGSVFFGRTSNQLTGSESFTSTDTVNDGNWHHVVCTVNDVTLKFYIDGSLDSTKTFVTATGDCSVGTTNSNFQIGARTTNSGGYTAYYEGSLEEVSFFDTELSSTNVTAIYNSGVPNNISGYPDLIGWYRMGDGDTYPTIQDNKGSNDATMTNMASDDIQTDVPS